MGSPASREMELHFHPQPHQMAATESHQRSAGLENALDRGWNGQGRAMLDLPVSERTPQQTDVHRSGVDGRHGGVKALSLSANDHRRQLSLKRHQRDRRPLPVNDRTLTPHRLTRGLDEQSSGAWADDVCQLDLQPSKRPPAKGPTRAGDVDKR